MSPYINWFPDQEHDINDFAIRMKETYQPKTFQELADIVYYRLPFGYGFMHAYSASKKAFEA